MSDNGHLDHMSARDRVEALLPFYLNGTLSGPELEEVEAWLRSDPDAPAALAEAELEFSATQGANEAIRPPSDALSRFTKSLEAEAGVERAASAPSLLARLWERMTTVPPAVAWATAAAALALVVVQAGMENLGQGPDYHVAGVETNAEETPFALVAFKPDARMADIAALLESQGASIEAGPKPGGFYKIGIPAKDEAAYNAISKTIAASPLVRQVIAGRKPRNGS